MDNYDYPAAANVWQRVNPQENPYPDANRGRFEMPMQGQMQTQSGAQSQSMRPAPMPLPTPMLPSNGAANGEQMYRALLREEMRHFQQVISMVEKALA